jgi:hypothetical protein
VISSSNPAAQETFAAALADASGGVKAEGEGWRAMVLAGAQVVDHRVPPMPERRALDPLIEQATTVDRALGHKLDAAVMNYGVAVFDAAVLLGAALVLTWPTRSDALDAWPDRALARAGIPTASETAPAPGDVSDDRLAEAIADRLSFLIAATLRAVLAAEGR